MEMFLDILLDAALDTLKLLPFLFLTYWAMEALEHRAQRRSTALVRSAGRLGPLCGGLLGAFPQCGFSAAASSLFAGRVITLGTLVAIYLSTSDEMLPLMLTRLSSSAATGGAASPGGPVLTLSKTILIVGAKAAIGIVSGFAVEAVRAVARIERQPYEIDRLCRDAHCRCEDGILVSAARHTAKMALFIFLVTLALGGAFALVGEDSLRRFATSAPMAGTFVVGLLGLIPNCAASVVITELYLSGTIDFGSMMSGLLVSAGVGLLVLFRTNRKPLQNLGVVVLLYALGVVWGTLLQIAHFEAFLDRF